MKSEKKTQKKRDRIDKHEDHWYVMKLHMPKTGNKIELVSEKVFRNRYVPFLKVVGPSTKVRKSRFDKRILRQQRYRQMDQGDEKDKHIVYFHEFFHHAWRKYQEKHGIIPDEDNEKLKESVSKPVQTESKLNIKNMKYAPKPPIKMREATKLPEVKVKQEMYISDLDFVYKLENEAFVNHTNVRFVSNCSDNCVYKLPPWVVSKKPQKDLVTKTHKSDPVFITEVSEVKIPHPPPAAESKIAIAMKKTKPSSTDITAMPTKQEKASERKLEISNQTKVELKSNQKETLSSQKETHDCVIIDKHAANKSSNRNISKPERDSRSATSTKEDNAWCLCNYKSNWIAKRRKRYRRSVIRRQKWEKKQRETAKKLRKWREKYQNRRNENMHEVKKEETPIKKIKKKKKNAKRKIKPVPKLFQLYAKNPWFNKYCILDNDVASSTEENMQDKTQKTEENSISGDNVLETMVMVKESGSLENKMYAEKASLDQVDAQKVYKDTIKKQKRPSRAEKREARLSRSKESKTHLGQIITSNLDTTEDKQLVDEKNDKLEKTLETEYKVDIKNSIENQNKGEKMQNIEISKSKNEPCGDGKKDMANETGKHKRLSRAEKREARLSRLKESKTQLGQIKTSTLDNIEGKQLVDEKNNKLEGTLETKQMDIKNSLGSQDKGEEMQNVQISSEQCGDGKKDMPNETEDKPNEVKRVVRLSRKEKRQARLNKTEKSKIKIPVEENCKTEENNSPAAKEEFPDVKTPKLSNDIKTKSMHETEELKNELEREIIVDEKVTEREERPGNKIVRLSRKEKKQARIEKAAKDKIKKQPKEVQKNLRNMWSDNHNKMWSRNITEPTKPKKIDLNPPPPEHNAWLSKPKLVQNDIEKTIDSTYQKTHLCETGREKVDSEKNTSHLNKINDTIDGQDELKFKSAKEKRNKNKMMSALWTKDETGSITVKIKSSSLTVSYLKKRFGSSYQEGLSNPRKIQITLNDDDSAVIYVLIMVPSEITAKSLSVDENIKVSLAR